MKRFNTKAELIEAFAQRQAATWAAERGNGSKTADIETERRVAAGSVTWTNPAVADLIGMPEGWSISGHPDFGFSLVPWGSPNA